MKVIFELRKIKSSKLYCKRTENKMCVVQYRDLRRNTTTRHVHQDVVK